MYKMGFKFEYNHILTNALILFILTFTCKSTRAQIFSSEQNPPSVKWHQLNTENFQIIYPNGLAPEAQRMANILEAIINKVSASLGKQPRKISVILQNQGTTANGFVQLAPRRSEFFTTPSQSFDYQNWLNSLAVHELRHVIQFDKLTGWFNKPPFESLALAIFGITLPSWFFEGDAVITETLLTEGGRGRIPEWYTELRTNTLSGKNYSYSKNYFGSVKDFTAGYYQLGFFMNTKLRRDHGNGINDTLLRRLAKNPFRPYNFSSLLKKLAGINSNQLYNLTIAEVEKTWKEQDKNLKTIPYASLNKRRGRTPENFLLPTGTIRESILYIKESKAETPALYELDKNGNSKKIINIGAQEIPWFSYAAGKIAWDESRFDARYQQRSFNVINLYDITTKRKLQITHKSRLFAPALSPDGKFITAVEVSLSQQISLVEISSQTGKELRRFPSPDNYMLQMPAYNQTGNKVAVVAVANTGKTIFELDLVSGAFTQLMPLKLQEILRPVYAGKQVVFKAHFNGIDNLYRLDPSDKDIYQITFSRFGAHNPFIDTQSGRLLFNNHTSRGYDISSIPLSGLTGINLATVAKSVVNYADPLIKEEGKPVDFESMPARVYPVKRYRELNNLFYFHSITPVNEDNPFFDDRNFGLRLKSDNKLNTLSFYTGYQFN